MLPGVQTLPVDRAPPVDGPRVAVPVESGAGTWHLRCVVRGRASHLGPLDELVSGALVEQRSYCVAGRLRIRGSQGGSGHRPALV